MCEIIDFHRANFPLQSISEQSGNKIRSREAPISLLIKKASTAMALVFWAQIRVFRLTKSVFEQPPWWLCHFLSLPRRVSSLPAVCRFLCLFPGEAKFISIWINLVPHIWQRARKFPSSASVSFEGCGALCVVLFATNPAERRTRTLKLLVGLRLERRSLNLPLVIEMKGNERERCLISERQAAEKLAHQRN